KQSPAQFGDCFNRHRTPVSHVCLLHTCACLPAQVPQVLVRQPVLDGQSRVPQVQVRHGAGSAGNDTKRSCDFANTVSNKEESLTKVPVLI
ncbi:MAG: hypothetical protein ABSF99_12345, partial [Anaerolineales bacterium]